MVRSGRPPGQPKTGGRKKGTPNKRDAEYRKKLAVAGDPVEFMLLVMNDTTQPMALRLDAARGAAPYLRARLAPLEPAKQDNGLTITIVGGLLECPT